MTTTAQDVACPIIQLNHTTTTAAGYLYMWPAAGWEACHQRRRFPMSGIVRTTYTRVTSVVALSVSDSYPALHNSMVNSRVITNGNRSFNIANITLLRFFFFWWWWSSVLVAQVISANFPRWFRNIISSTMPITINGTAYLFQGTHACMLCMAAD